jgi:hypothetical protein
MSGPVGITVISSYVNNVANTCTASHGWHDFKNEGGVRSGARIKGSKCTVKSGNRWILRMSTLSTIARRGDEHERIVRRDSGVINEGMKVLSGYSTIIGNVGKIRH